VQAGLPGSIRHQLALLLSELVTNGIQHGGAGVEHSMQVRVATSPQRVRVEVFDPGGNGDEPANRIDENGGYGLVLVDRLSDAWGQEATEAGGSVAWFELDLSGLGD
jgi:anti-sigma regulatory factor (Ser/Thr protein kinase)